MALRLLQRAVVGTNYSFLRAKIQKLGLDTTHWQQFGRPCNRVTDIEIFAQNSQHARGHVKKRFLRLPNVEKRCAVCGLVDWMNKPIVLRLDHINGEGDDCRVENLRLICPNCDSQSSTYCGRNKHTPVRAIKTCVVCHCTLSRAAKFDKCRKHIAVGREPKYKIAWPSREELMLRVSATSINTVAAELGVSWPAVKKHLASVAQRQSGQL